MVQRGQGRARDGARDGVYDHHSEVARTLLCYHAALELDDEYARTALIHAEQNGSLMTVLLAIEAEALKNVRLLLDAHGVNLTLQDEFGQTSLAMAIQAQVLGEPRCTNSLCDQE